MKKVTAITIFDTAVGTRASIVYSEINDDGVIVKVWIASSWIRQSLRVWLR